MTKEVVHWPDVFSSIVITDVSDDRSDTFALHNENGASEFLLITVISDGAAGGDGTSSIVLECRAVVDPNQNMLQADGKNALHIFDASMGKTDTVNQYPLLNGADPAATEFNLQLYGKERQTPGPLTNYMYLRLIQSGTAYTTDANKVLKIDIYGFG